MNTSEIQEFYNQFKADLLAGVVSNWKTYVESKLPGLTKDQICDIVDDLEMMMQDDNIN
jgi:hypothetical protein